MAKKEGRSDAQANAILDHELGGPDYTRLATVYFGYLLTLPAASGVGGVEPAVGAYARKGITNNATNFPAASGRRKQNGVAITCDQATQDQGLAIGWGLWAASTGGNPIRFGKLVGAWKVFTALASTDVMTSTAHGFVDGDAVEIQSESGSVPTGLAEETKYYVVNSATNTFKLAATLGGAAIDLTTDGSGLLRVAKSYRQQINQGGQLVIPIGALILDEV